MMEAKTFIRSAPHLPVKNLQQTLDYYRDKLGFYDEWIFENKDGGIRRDDMRLLFTEDSTFLGDINNQKHRLPLLWFVDNIDEIFSELKKREIEIADDLKIHPYGLKEFAFLDINGYYIRVSEGVDGEEPPGP
jgi:catechol 2,3-dioxygenase-like lactoylglutathione lyase family enzyme